MKNKIFEKLAFAIPLLFLIVLSFESSSCSIPTESTEEDTTYTDSTGPIIRKPNIYIYPTEEIELNIKINFPNGGEVIESIPEYDNGWNIKVDTTGLINNYYRYLYYECTAPDLYQDKKGWVVHKDNLTTFFKNNLYETGFSDLEINDFIEYWIPVLNSSEYYVIYPQYKEDLSSIVELEFSNIPDNLLRLFYLIKEFDEQFLVESEPEIPTFTRSGYYVVEWGVIVSDEIFKDTENTN